MAVVSVLLGTALVGGGFIAPGVAVAAGDANQASCGAETEASPGFRSYLPDCRAYELVTPPYQGGQPAFGVGRQPPPMSPDGQHLLGVAYAGYAGTENEEQSGFEYGAIYEFSRTPYGWQTESLEPPASRYPRRSFVAASADLSRSLWNLVIPANEGEEVGVPQENGGIYAIRERPAGGQAQFTVVGPVVAPEHESGEQGGFGFMGASRDLSHILEEIRSEHKQLWPGDTTAEGGKSLYEYAGTSGSEPVLVGVKNAGPLTGEPHRNEGAELESECGIVLGSRLGGQAPGTTYNAVSADGSNVYFTAVHKEGCPGGQPAVNELFARIDGSRTVAISEPVMSTEREAECSGVCREDENSENGHTRNPALFEGASEDGSKVFFTTEQPLLNSDQDSTRDLYEADIEGGTIKRLVQVSHDAIPSQAANVISVARISEDGSHVYYVARGSLASNANANGEKAELGAYNLYAYDTKTMSTAFVATLLTVTEEQAIKAEIEAEESEQERKIRIQEERTAIQAKTVEIESRRAELSIKKAECQRYREKGELELAEECDAQVANKEAEIAEEATELAEAEAKLIEEEAGLSEEVAQPLAEAVEAKTGVTAVDEHRPFETTPDGRFLVFGNERHLTGSEDTSTVAQIFEYDSETAHLARVSIGQRSEASPAGYGDNGNTTNAADAPKMLRTPTYAAQSKPTDASSQLSVSESGAVVFTAGDALTPRAVEGRENVYEYREGNVYLISPGDEPTPLYAFGSRLLGTDESGSDAFFFTTNSLVPQDTDTQASWYDARVGGGFPAPVSPSGCAGDACLGPLSGAPPTPAVGSTGAAEGNLAPPASTAAPPLTRAMKLAKALRACRKKPSKRRSACIKDARKRYGSMPRTSRSHRASKSHRKGK